jgi:tRNA(Glu) U13 pseudouridine synthase TruD
MPGIGGQIKHLRKDFRAEQIPLYPSAFQSAIFSRSVACRLQALDKALTGSLAEKTETGDIFTVEDVSPEQPRAGSFDISPTGPLPGYRSNLPAGEAARMQPEALAKRGGYLELKFTAPPGCYGGVALREIMNPSSARLNET